MVFGFFFLANYCFFDGFFGESGVIVVVGGDFSVNPLSGQKMGKSEKYFSQQGNKIAKLLQLIYHSLTYIFIFVTYMTFNPLKYLLNGKKRVS